MKKSGPSLKVPSGAKRPPAEAELGAGRPVRLVIRPIVPDGSGRLRLAGLLVVTAAPIDDTSLAHWVLLSAFKFVSLPAAFPFKKHVECAASSCSGNLQDDPMDVDPAPPPSPSSPALRGLPFLGELINGVCEVVHCDLRVPSSGSGLCPAILVRRSLTLTLDLTFLTQATSSRRRASGTSATPSASGTRRG